MTAVPLAFYPDTNQWLPTESGSAFLEDFGTGVGLGDVTKDTSALQAAMATPEVRISGRSGVPFYYIAEGAVCASGAYLSNIVLKLKLGTGGFNNTLLAGGTISRYSQQNCALCWSAADGGGWNNLEIYGDGLGARGKDYANMALAVNGGMTTKPFVGSGRLYVHHMAGVNGAAVCFNSIGPAGWHFDTMEFWEINTNLPKASWGSPAFVQVTGFSLDNDTGGILSSRGTFRQIIAPRGRVYTGGALRAENGDQSDLVTFAVSTPDDTGPLFDTIYYHGVNGEDNVGEVLDNFACGVNGNRIIGYNVADSVFKTGGGQRVNIRNLHGENVGRYIAVIYAGATVPTEQINIGSVTGKGVGGFFLNTGTLQAATATTATLAMTASPVDNYYGPNSQIVITGGTAIGSRGVVAAPAYNGTTKVLTVASWSAGTPDNTSTYGMQVTAECRAVDFEAGDQAGIFDCTVNIDGVRNTGYMDEIVRTNLLTAVSKGNRIVINQDLGFQTASVVGFAITPGMRVLTGEAAKSITRLYIPTNQVIATGTETTLNFTSVDKDTSVGGRVDGVQSLNAATEKGIRVRLPGLKRIHVSLLIGGIPIGDRSTVSIKRGSTVIVSRVIRPDSTSSFGCDIVHTTFHENTYFGAGTENLYTVTVSHSTSTGYTYTAGATNCYFEIEG